MNQFVEFATYLALTSMAAERLVELIKKTFFENKTVKGTVYQGIAAIFGGLMAYASPPSIPSVNLNEWALIIIVGLAVSGGSGFWNSILSIMMEYKKNLSAPKETKAVE